MMACVPDRVVEPDSMEDPARGDIEEAAVFELRKCVIRRRPTPQQGRSLEMLGHAIEYLVDSDLSSGRNGSDPAAAEAARILMRLSREVFSECPEVVPFWRGVRERAGRLLHRGAHGAGATAPASGPRT